MSAWGSASTTAALEPGREVELELTEGTRVAGKVVQVDGQGVVLECADSHERARIAASEVAAVVHIVSTDPHE
jgi:exosome complex RNA-binding protein Csl4